MPVTCPPDDFVLLPVDIPCTPQANNMLERQHVRIITTFERRQIEMYVPLGFILDNVLTGIGNRISQIMREKRAIKEVLNLVPETPRAQRPTQVIGFNVEYDRDKNHLSITTPYVRDNS